MVSVSYKFVLAVILIAVPFVLGCLSFALGITALWAVVVLFLTVAFICLRWLYNFRM